MDSRSFLSLLQFSDGLFPAGGYAHSYGLETYVQEGVIRDFEGVEKFIRSYLEGSAGSCDAVAVVAALNFAQEENLAACLELDETLEVMKPVAEFREASGQMGRQTLRVAVAITNHSLLSALMKHVEAYRTPGHHAVVFGMVGGVLGWPKLEAATAFLYATTSLLVGASLRLLSIGQVAGQSLLHRLGPLIADLAAAAKKGSRRSLILCPGH